MYLRCQKCGKRLTDPESMKRGYGPECWEKLTGDRRGLPGTMPDDYIPGQLSLNDIMEGECNDHQKKNMSGMWTDLHTASGTFPEG